MTSALRPATRITLGILGVVGVLVSWQIAVETGFVSALTLPAPTAVIPAIVDLLGTAEFRSEVLDTLTTWLVAMVVMTATAVPLGLAVGSLRGLLPPTSGLVHVLRSIPPTALIPIAILFFGLGIQMKLAVVCYAIAWPLLLNAMYGAQSVDPVSRMAARSLRLNRWRIFRSLTLPSAARYIGTGVRLAGGIGFVVVLGAELLGASSGVGTEIVRYQQAELRDLVFAGIVIIGVVGVTMFELLQFLERRLSSWAPEHRTT